MSTWARIGLIARARTLKVIEATADGVDRIPFIYDTDAVTLEVGQGCEGVSGDLRQLREDVFITDILLAKNLSLGETLTLEYWNSFHYRDDRIDAGKREYRRASMRRAENFDIRVEFHPGRLPRGIWWAVWDGVDGDVITEEPAGARQPAFGAQVHAVAGANGGRLPLGLVRRPRRHGMA